MGYDDAGWIRGGSHLRTLQSCHAEREVSLGWLVDEREPSTVLLAVPVQLSAVSPEQQGNHL